MEKRWLISKYDNNGKVELDEFIGSDSDSLDHIKQVFEKEFGMPHFGVKNNDDVVHSETGAQFIKKFEISKFEHGKVVVLHAR